MNWLRRKARHWKSLARYSVWTMLRRHVILTIRNRRPLGWHVRCAGTIFNIASPNFSVSLVFNRRVYDWFASRGLGGK